MPTYLENIQAALDNLAAALADMTANPKPNYSVDGQSFSWQSLFDSYTDRLEKLKSIADGPVSMTSLGE